MSSLLLLLTGTGTPTGITYNIYRNDGAGGPVDYSAVVANTSALTYTLPALSLDSDNLIAVRAYDSGTGLEDKNVDAVVRIVIDAGGVDVTNRPSPPIHVTAEADGAGKALATWSFNPVAFGGRPTGFKVWLTAGSSVNYAASPDATVPFDNAPVQPTYAATLSGLADGTTYTVGVRSYNATGLSLVADAEPQVVGRVSTAPDAPDHGSSSVGFAP